MIGKEDSKKELHPGTTINECAGCGKEFVVFQELADIADYCEPMCKEQHSIFTSENE